MTTTITNVIPMPAGRARSRKDSYTCGSIPTLMALDEEDGNHSPSRILHTNDEPKNDTQNVMTTLTTTTMTLTPNKTVDMRKYSDSNLPAPTFSDMPSKQNKTKKSSRRSSLGLGLLMGSNKNDSNKNGNGGKRRSSFAAILGRRNSKVC